MKFTGVVATADEITIQGYYYPKEVIEKAVADAQEKIKNGEFMGGFGYVGKNGLYLEDIALLVTDLHMKDSQAIVEADILDTPKGRVLAKFYEAGVGLRASFCGYGTLIDDAKRVSDDYSLNYIKIDLEA